MVEPASLETEFHLPSPWRSTYSMSNLSSSAVQGPFLHASSSVTPHLMFPAMTFMNNAKIIQNWLLEVCFLILSCDDCH